MMADIIFAHLMRHLANLEVSVGTFPGIGGTQRLIRRIGLPKAMDIILENRKYLDTKPTTGARHHDYFP